MVVGPFREPTRRVSVAESGFTASEVYFSAAVSAAVSVAVVSSTASFSAAV